MGTFRPEPSEQASPLTASQLANTIAEDQIQGEGITIKNPEPEMLSGLTLLDTLWDWYEENAYKHEYDTLACTCRIVPKIEGEKNPYNITPLSFRQLVNMTMVDPQGLEIYPPLEDYERLIDQVNSHIVPDYEWRIAMDEVERCHAFLDSYLKFHRILQFKPLLDYMNLYAWWQQQVPITELRPNAKNELPLGSEVYIDSPYVRYTERWDDVQCYAYIYRPDDGVNPNDKRVQEFLDWLGSFLEPDPSWDDESYESYIEKRPTFPFDALPRPENIYMREEFWLRIDFPVYYKTILKHSIDKHYIYYEYKELFDWFAFVYTRLILEIKLVDAQLLKIIDQYKTI